VRDANGQALVHIYARATESEAAQAKVLTMDEARRIAPNIAKPPELPVPKKRPRRNVGAEVLPKLIGRA